VHEEEEEEEGEEEAAVSVVVVVVVVVEAVHERVPVLDSKRNHGVSERLIISKLTAVSSKDPKRKKTIKKKNNRNRTSIKVLENDER